MYYKPERVGETNLNKYGNKMKIIKYNHSKDIDVLFEDYNYIEKKKHYIYFKNGTLTSPYDKTVYNKGYLGEGLYKKCKDNKLTLVYSKWKSMFDRCYDGKLVTYSGCSVCEEWHNFQHFAKWFEKNYYKIKNEKMCLDKDILIKGNKIYSPETCIIVPNSINILFVRNHLHRNNTPIGVSKYNDKFIARCKIGGKSTHIGVYDTEDRAFKAYKNYKEKHIKEVADKYKDEIPKILYNAMYKWEVCFND
jgi:hypothetical protein